MPRLTLLTPFWVAWLLLVGYHGAHEAGCALNETAACDGVDTYWMEIQP